MEPMKKLALVALAGLTLATAPTRAADLFGSAPQPLSIPASSGPTAEVGTNWYIRGDIGVSLDTQPSLSPTGAGLPAMQNWFGFVQNDAPAGAPGVTMGAPFGPSQTTRQLSFDVGAGYRVNDYLRIEGVYNYRTGPGSSASTTVICPQVATAVSNNVITNSTTDANGNVVNTYALQPVGYTYDTSTCSGVLNLTQHNQTGLVSGYIDFGNYWGFTPYIGAGVGINVNSISGNVKYVTTATGAPYAGNIASGAAPPQYVYLVGATAGLQNTQLYALMPKQPAVPLGTQNWNRNFSSTKFNPAIAFMAGFGYQLTPSATLDIGYRFLSTGSVNNSATTSQQVKVGIRYMAN